MAGRVGELVDLVLHGPERRRSAVRAFGGRFSAEALQVADHFGAGAAAEHDGLQQGVAAQAVGAVDAHAGALAGGVEAGHRRGAVEVGVDAAHGVVLARHHRDGLLDGVDAFEVDGQVADAGQPLQDLLGAQVAEVQVDVALAVDAPAFVDLGLDGAGHDVARREFHELGRVLLHVALAQAVDQVAAFAAGALGHEDLGGEEPGGVELDELHVLERHAGLVGHGHAAAGVDERVGGVASRCGRSRRWR